MLGSTLWRTRMSDSADSHGRGESSMNSVTAICRAVPNAPVRGMLGDINLTGVLDSATNCGGELIRSAGTLIDPCLASIDWETRTAWVAAGATVSAISRALLIEGWVLEHLGGASTMTLGGMLALEVQGPYSRRRTKEETLPRKIQFVDGRGQRRKLARDAKDATNLAAVVGALGLTGYTTAAQVAIRPVSSGWMLVDSRKFDDFEGICEELLTIPVDHYAYAKLDPTAVGSGHGRGTVVTGRHARVVDLPATRQAGALEYVASTPVRSATVLPLKLSGTSGTRAIQTLTHRTAAPLRRDQLVPISTFFHSVAEARLESKRAAKTLTYEFAVPTEHGDLIPQFLERLVQVDGTGDHATLQRCSKSLGAPLSYTIDGWLFGIELASDSPGLGRMLDEWDERVTTAGGRVVLASDSRIRPDVLSTMYPGLQRWHALRDELDPGRIFCSDLSRRLNL